MGVRLWALGVSPRRPESDPEVEAYYHELRSLAESAGHQVVVERVRVGERPDPRTYVGAGMLKAVREELAQVRQRAQEGAGEEGPALPDGVLLAHEVAPRVLAAVEDALEVPVLDRTGLILQVFAQRAQSSVGRLQVELARLRYELPRLRGSYASLSRPGGGVGVRGGAGETAWELERRRIRRRMAELQRELQRVQRERRERRAQRKESLLVSLCGYTNAGKTTLMGALVGRPGGGHPRLFDTLDPATRRVRLPVVGPVLLTDTVGFVRDLPPGLTSAFEATLEELADCDLLLHVVDGSLAGVAQRYEAVRAILQRVGAGEVPELTVLTHAGQGGEGIVEPMPGAVVVDAVTGYGLFQLRQRLGERLGRLREWVQVVVTPGELGAWLHYVEERGAATARPLPNGTFLLEACVGPREAGILRRRLPAPPTGGNVP